MTGRFNDRARRAIDYAVQCARSFGHSYVGSEHLLMGILQVTESTASMLLRERGVTEQKLREDIAELSGVSEPSEAAVGDMTPVAASWCAEPRRRRRVPAMRRAQNIF